MLRPIRGSRLPSQIPWAAGLLMTTLSASLAFAQPQQTHRAVAQRLFEQGRALMQAGRFDEACPKLAESHRLDPAGGTVLNLAICYEKHNKTATAWVTFEDARASARRDRNQQRLEYATKHIEALQSRLSYVTVVVGDAAPGLDIRLDGRLLAPPVWGTDIPVDPGTHRVEASAPQRAAWTHEVVIRRDAERVSIAIPVLTPSTDTLAEPQPAQPSKPVAAPPATTRAAPSTREPAADDAGGTSTLGYVIGGVGVAAVGFGSYFGIRAMSAWNDRNDHCDGTGCDEAGLVAGDDADGYAKLSNVGFGIGLIGLGLGTYLVLSDDAGARGTRIEPTVASSGGGVTLRGAW